MTMTTALLGKTDYMIPELDPNFLSGALGVSEAVLEDIGKTLAETFTLEHIRGTGAALANALEPFSASDRQTIIASFLAFGGDPQFVRSAIGILDDPYDPTPGARKLRIAWIILGTASMAAGAFHGYRRNQSVGWALWWGLMGSLFPIVTPAIAVAQGFGQRK